MMNGGLITASESPYSPVRRTSGSSYIFPKTEEKISLSASVEDEDFDRTPGHSSSDEDYYSSPPEDEEVKRNSRIDIDEDPKHSTYVLNDSVKIKVAGPEQWLCLARLPGDLEETEFLELVSGFGSVKRHLLVRSSLTGKFKGYGLVEYLNKSSSIQAKHILDGHVLRNHALEADWLSCDRINATSLHSKCLFVDQLPRDYRDMRKFRKLFSSVVNPPYCQIAMKNGVIQNWGLVEFQNSHEAEKTLMAIDGYEIVPGRKIRVQYCIPGVHAINVYMSFVNNPMDALEEKKALLEETPPTKVYDQLESLSKQNPWFVQSLQNIMAMNNGGEALKEPPKPAHKGDPAQAALVLLLAGTVAKSKENKSQSSTTSLLQSVITRLESGVSATEILKSFIPPSTTDLRSFISDLLVKNESSHNTFYSPPQQTKDPTLTDLLLQSFQASLNKGKCSRASPPPPLQPSRVTNPPKPVTRPLNKPPSVKQPPPPPPQPKVVVQPPQTTSPPDIGVFSRAAPPQTYAVYATPQLQPYRPPAPHHPHHQPQNPQAIFNPSFYPGLWAPSQVGFPLNIVAPQWTGGGGGGSGASLLPVMSPMDAANSTPYLTAVAYAAANPKRKYEVPFYGDSLNKKMKLNQEV